MSLCSKFLHINQQVGCRTVTQRVVKYTDLKESYKTRFLSLTWPVAGKVSWLNFFTFLLLSESSAAGLVKLRHYNVISALFRTFFLELLPFKYTIRNMSQHWVHFFSSRMWIWSAFSHKKFDFACHACSIKSLGTCSVNSVPFITRLRIKFSFPYCII